MSPQTAREPRILRIFISYASEDLKIAHAIATNLSDALPDGFAEVCFDKWFLQAGAEFKKQIEQKLEKTDIFIIVYTGVDKPAYSFPGWELGFFEALKKNDPRRRIVPVFLESLPHAAPEYEGVSLKISRELLQLSVEEFTSRNEIADDDPVCMFVGDLQEEAEKIKEEAGFSRAPLRDRRDPVKCVKNVRLAIFLYLKTTVERVLKPQKEITIRTTGFALESTEADLPRDAKLIPVSGNPMSIFGLGDEVITWERFLQLTSGPHRDSWREAISSVVRSSRAERIDVDNCQIVPSSDESKIYRIVLTTATKYWDDNREFNLYFVETYQEEEYGNKDTTLTLKGLEAVCRFRFMFLEAASEFSANSILATRDDRFPEMAATLLRELNLMKTKSGRAGLDKPGFWSQFGGWPILLEIRNTFQLKQGLIRELLGRVLNKKCNKDSLATLRQELSKEIGELEDATRKQNAVLIEAMATKLLALVKN